MNPTDERSRPIAPYLWMAAIVAWVVASRLPYVNDFAMMGKDGEFYVNALKLDRTYNVPPPGNLGYVLLGKLANLACPNPVHAFAAVNIGLTAAAACSCFLLASRSMPRPLAAAAVFAMTSNPLVWWYGPVVASYLVWLAILPTIAVFGLRFADRGRWPDLIGASLALGIGTILRQDLVAFGTPLWAGCLILGRASARQWLVGGMIVASCCVVWFLGTSAILGGPGEYLDRLRDKHAHDRGYSPSRRGLFEGLLRNGSKYALFLAWTAHLVLVPFVAGLLVALRAASDRWRMLLLSLLWAGPSWYFAFFVFAGTGGLIFPFLPLVYLGAARGLKTMFAGSRRPALAMAALGLLGLAQFTLTPLPPAVEQRGAILNVMFFRYGAAGLRNGYNFDLADFGIDQSLSSVLRQLRRPEPLPRNPRPS